MLNITRKKASAASLLTGLILFFISLTTFAANVTGSIPGKFSVSPSGAATYSIPIEVPPGVNGLHPV